MVAGTVRGGRGWRHGVFLQSLNRVATTKSSGVSVSPLGPRAARGWGSALIPLCCLSSQRVQPQQVSGCVGWVEEQISLVARRVLGRKSSGRVPPPLLLTSHPL